jgi:hypothetical protein
MAAVDAGFDLGPTADGRWLRFNSAGSLATVWLDEVAKAYIVAVAPERVASEVGGVYAVEMRNGERPAGCAVVWCCPSRVALGELLRRVAILGRVLPACGGR